MGAYATLKSKVLALYHNQEALRYLIFGGLNTFLTWLVFSGLILLGAHYLIANSLAWIVGILVSFTFNLKFVFKSDYQHKRFLQFVGSNIFSFFLSSAVLALLIDGLGVPPIIASIIAIPVVVVANFILFKYVVFKPTKAKGPDQP